LAFFFFVGLMHSLIRRDKVRAFLFVAVLLYLAQLTVIVRQITLRYTSPIYPLFAILAIISAIDVGRSLANKFGKWVESPVSLRAMVATMIVATLVFGDEYHRLFFVKNERLVRGTTEAARFVREHASEADIVMSPTAPPAAVELGGLDYYISGNLLYFDIPYRDGNYVRDRWGGGTLVSNPEAFCRVFENADRVWIYFDDLTEARLSPEMRYYLRTTGQPVMESYAAIVRLWERDRDPFPTAPRSGRELGAY
jgi:hypothetical protein